MYGETVSTISYTSLYLNYINGNGEKLPIVVAVVEITWHVISVDFSYQFRVEFSSVDVSTARCIVATISLVSSQRETVKINPWHMNTTP